MSARGILDADMATVAGWIRDGWRWWLDELSAMLPERSRALGRSSVPVVRFDGAGLPEVAGGAVAVSVAPALCLVRVVERPTLADRDIGRMLAFEAERILPMPAEAMIAAGRVLARQGGSMRLAAAGLPIASARALAEAAAKAHLRPTRVFVDHPAGAIELLPALREAGLLQGGRGSARGWWGVVALLFAINLASIVWRDVAEVDRLQEIVDTQTPAVTVSRAIAGRMRAGQRIAQQSARRRAAFDPLGTMARVAGALPPGAWVQRYSWSGDTLKLAGYRPRDANVVAALRRLPGVTEVRNTAADSVAEVPAGQPFDVTVRLAAGDRR